MKKILLQLEEKRYNIIKRIADAEERSVNAQIRLLLKQAVSYYIRYKSEKIELNENEKELTKKETKLELEDIKKILKEI